MTLIQMSQGEWSRTPVPPVEQPVGLRLISVFCVLVAAFSAGALCRHIIASGHPLIAGWLVAMLLAWLFLLGAGKASAEP
jgi:hypothetical protein